MYKKKLGNGERVFLVGLGFPQGEVAGFVWTTESSF
jgi:hypothetical protein